jgi:hypothetical protein
MDMYALSSPFRILISPFRSAQALPASARVRPAALLVLGAGLFMAAGMLVSHLNHAYPPAPNVLKIWVETWGEYVMLPFLKIPPESYRLFLAVIMVPLAYAIWMLMAGTAKLLSLFMGGRASYEQYLVITAFSFFPFWILAGNEAIFQLMMVAYNLFLLFKIDCVRTTEYQQQIKTFWVKYIFLAGKIIRTARSVVMKLSEKYPYREIYEKSYS